MTKEDLTRIKEGILKIQSNWCPYENCEDNYCDGVYTGLDYALDVLNALYE